MCSNGTMHLVGLLWYHDEDREDDLSAPLSCKFMQPTPEINHTISFAVG